VKRLVLARARLVRRSPRGVVAGALVLTVFEPFALDCGFDI
jgi:hypothetical protein